MNDSYNELGENVTHLATTSRKKDTSVVSVRLSGDDITRLENIARENGKTVSQIIRDAIASYRTHSPTMVVGLWNGSTVTVGQPDEISSSARCEVTYPPSRPNPA